MRLSGRMGRSMGGLLLLLLLGPGPIARAANPVLLIQGTRGPSGGTDVTAFVDQIEIVQVSTGAVVPGAVANPGFETFGALGNGNYGYTPAGAAWTFNARSGIALNGSNFGAPNAPQGSAVAFVQSDASINGLLQQTLTLGTGTYYVRFQVAQRNCCSTNDQGLTVLVAGNVVGSVQPVNNGTFTSYSSGTFTVDAPAVSSFTPTRNALAAALATNVAVSFSQNIDNATASNIKVFSAQAGGRKAGTYGTSGATVTFDPTANFKPGETVFASIPTAVASTGGASTTNKQVYQFTAAAGGTGRGNFLPGSDLTNANGVEVLAADFNGDGILDLADTGGGLEVRFGTGTGTYGAATAYASAGGYFSLTAGDLDGDGDIDLVVPRNGGTIAVMQNNGAGVFTALTAAASNGGDPRKAALGDIDADGDLDMLVPISGGGGAVGVYFNNGSGGFSAPASYTGSANSTYVVLGDVDRDGDLDYAVADYNNARVVVRLNNGSGSFSGGSNVAVGGGPNGLALADVNGDSALDIVTANEGTAALSVSLNGNTGTGSFNATSSFAVPAICSGLAVGDVDADGDLDLVAGSRGATGFYLLLNNGAGSFGSAGSIAATTGFFYLALADLDNDNDLDLAGAAINGSAVSVRLNQQLAPTINSFSPTSAGAGVPVTLTGTNLTGATALTINSAAATILTNTGTSLTFRVPAGATATGTSSVTTPGGTASSTAFTFLPAPGNALAFDGSDDYVTGTMAALPQGNTARTLEAWVLTTATGGVIFNYGTASSNQRSGVLVSGAGHLYYVGEFNDQEGNIIINDGKWHHVAATYNGSLLSLFVDGVLDVSSTRSAFSTTGTTWRLGSRILTGTALGEQFNGRIDEMRVYSAALTAAQVQADMRSTSPALPGSLVAYFSFDEGTPGGNNTGLTTLYDQSSSLYTGTLTNYTSPGLTSGNTTSNWVESYALVVPTATAATALTANGFTANWTAPVVGTVDNGYRLDVATNATFTAGLTTYTVASGLSQAVTGLTASTTYYYRVRADKTSVTGQGAYSNAIAVATCALPVAIAQSVTVALNGSGTAAATAAAVNNGSTANCGPAAAGSLSLSPSSFSCTDVAPANVARSLSFNGAGQYVAIPTSSTVPVGNSSYTIEAWIKPTAMGDYGIIGWGNYGTTNQVNALRLYNSGLINYWWANDIIISTPSLAGAWHHVAATFNGTTRTLYLDGVAIGTDTPTGHAVPTASNLRIGSTNNSEYFPGSIDEVRVWSVARTAAQINAAKGAGLPGSTAGLVAYYRLNEGSGLTAADATGTAANLGTLTNGPTWTTDAPAVTTGVPVTLTVTDATGNTSTATALVTVQDNLAPTAVAQPVSLPLTINSTATLTASALNNGSSDNCSPLTFGVQKVVSGVVGEGGSLTLTAPAGMVFTAITFASYGTPINNGNGTYSINSGCHSTISQSQAAAYLLGQNSATIPAANGVFGDPCGGTVKTLVVQAVYGSPLAQATYACAETGTRLALLSVTDASGNTSTQVATVTVTVPATPTTTWSGASSTDWADCANWSYGKVPDATTSVVIPTGQPRYPALTTGNTYAVLDLTVNTGGSLTLANGATLQVSGNFAGNGTATLSGTVAFVGSAATQALGGSTSTPFTTLVVNKASGTVQLGQILTINSGLALTSGTLTTGSYQVNLGGSASISETETSYVIGTVAVNRTLTAGAAQGFSGLGLTLTPAAGSVSPGATLVVRTTGTALSGAGTSQSVKRYFDIRPTVNTGLNVTMDFGYFTHELNGIPTANLTLFKSVTTTAGPWANLRPTATGANVVTRAGISDFSLWTLGNSTNPLPVELTAFTATADGPAAVRLAWTTASEKNSARFEVERSLSGTAFERIGTVAGQGTKASATDYALLDGKLPASAATLYYRLKQFDLDGTATYSPVRTVAFAATTMPQLRAYPSPAHATVRVLLLGPATSAPLQVYDALGRVVYAQGAPAIGTETVLPLAGLPTGVYVLRCGSLAQRFTLE
ncbi:hypothetical protein GCM10027345_09440 [Hymenobacter daeguensis]